MDKNDKKIIKNNTEVIKSLEKSIKKSKITEVILSLVIVILTGLMVNSSIRETNLIERSYLPNIYPTQFECPNALGDYSYEISFYLGNFGKIPTSTNLIFEGRNIEAVNLNPFGNLTYSESIKYSFMFVPIEFMDNEQIYVRYRLKIREWDEKNASFIIKWEYEIDENKKRGGEFHCNYSKSEDLFVKI